MKFCIITLFDVNSHKPHLGTINKKKVAKLLNVFTKLTADIV